MNLTVPRLEAIAEALASRLAGEIDSDIARKHYEAAETWAFCKLRKLRERQ
jgi:hypothetical protein